MTNKEIARAFQDLAAIMELHEENAFKIKTYQNAYITLRKLETPLADCPLPVMQAIKGIGKSTAEKIMELLQTGQLQAFQTYAQKTPAGVIKMLQIKGLGVKKIHAIWKQLGIETIGELLYACAENRLIELHGFGKKTQTEIQKVLEYYFKSEHQIHFATVEATAHHFLNLLKKMFPNAPIAFVGAFRRKLPVIERVEILLGLNPLEINELEGLKTIQKKEQQYVFTPETLDNAIESAILYTCEPNDFGSKQFLYTGTRPFLDAFVQQTQGISFKNLPTETAVFEKANIPYLDPVLRENADFILKKQRPQLITVADLQGVIHTHTTYSDGLNTLSEMAHYAKTKGFKYIGITDHSKAAFYANGLKEERLYQQWAEIDALNKTFTDFKILKGIESDILNDGSLDYAEDILKQFDFIIASIHTNLKMDIDKATTRLIKAIENPYTTILGHPTGRLLLSREGYPIDYQKVIDACAANRVAIELNAHPYRLDLDWTKIPMAMDKGVLIGIHPDAHSCAGIDHVQYGVFAAQKGGLEPKNCLNCLNINDFLNYKKTI
jgi:DNA polymerase (family X)